MITDTPERLAYTYVQMTQRRCKACAANISVCTNPDAHTCAYGDELYANFETGVRSPYQHVTDAMCPSHGHYWVHVGKMSRRDKDGFWNRECSCGFAAQPVHESCASNGPENIHAAHAFGEHQAHFCTCYYEKKERLSYQEQEIYDLERGALRIPVSYVFATTKFCDACIRGFSQLEAVHTCLYATGELTDLMYLENNTCPTHSVQTGEDGYGHYNGHLAVSDTEGHYRCRACEFTTSTFTNLASNIIATREMARHRASHCTCSYIDRLTYRASQK